MEIKICGITNLTDARECVEAGADALGFIFYSKSPRYISRREARNIAMGLPQWVIKVGVFVDEDAEVVRQISDEVPLDMVQLHGSEPPDYCRLLGPSRVIKAIFGEEDLRPFLSPLGPCPLPSPDKDRPGMTTAASARKGRGGGPLPSPVAAFLVDARDHRPGGTGKRADWSFARNLAARCPVILAGGLKGENIISALEEVKPRALDINSGVEQAPGKKDRRLVQEVIDQVRRWEINMTEAKDRIFLPRPVNLTEVRT